MPQPNASRRPGWFFTANLHAGTRGAIMAVRRATNSTLMAARKHYWPILTKAIMYNFGTRRLCTLLEAAIKKGQISETAGAKVLAKSVIVNMDIIESQHPNIGEFKNKITPTTLMKVLEEHGHKVKGYQFFIDDKEKRKRVGVRRTNVDNPILIIHDLP